MKMVFGNRKCFVAILITFLIIFVMHFTSFEAVSAADGVCEVGDVLASGESCTYPGTDTAFSVNSNGNGQFLFFSSGSRLNIRDTQINNVSYTLVAEKLDSGDWEIKELGTTAAPPPTTNHAPVFTDGASTTRTIAENTASGVNIGNAVAATDTDNDTLTYSLGGTDAASFNIDTTTGQLKTSSILNANTQSTYTVTVSVSDGNSGSDSITVTITVAGDDTPPPPVADGICRVGDTLAAGESCTYPGTDTEFSVNSNGNGQFLFFSSGSRLNIRDTQINNVSYTLVAEKLNSGSWEIKELGATAAPPSTTNNAPVFTDGASTTRTVAENTTAGVNIGTPVSATDADSGDTLTYTLGGTDAASFDIDSKTGQLQTKAALNAETKATYTVTITVSDGTLTDTIPVTITVTGTGIVPPPVADGICRVGDMLTPGENCTYPGTDTEFSVNSNGNGQFLFFSSSSRLNIRNTQINNVSYTLVAEKLNSGSWEIKELGTTAAPPPTTNHAPVFTDGASTTRPVTENTATGVNIGTSVAATDADNDTLTYTLGGTDAAAFSIVSTTGQLQTKAALNAETKATYTVTITVSDGTLTDTITVTINVTGTSIEPPPVADGICRVGDMLEPGESCTYPGTDTDFSVNSNGNGQFLFFSSGSRLNIRNTQINNVSYTLVAEKLDSGSWEIKELGATAPPPTTNNAPVFTEGASTTRTVAENTASGQNIGTSVAATDADNDTLTYTLGGDPDAAAFHIDSATGQLQTNAALDYETKSSYSVSVSVSDGKGGTDSIDVTITVTDVNDAPVFTDGTSTTRAVAENTASGTNIGTAVAATDADKDTLTYTLGGTDAAAFRIVSTTGQLRTHAALNYETKNTYSVSVSVSDSKGGMDRITVTINVTNVNENRAPVFTGGSGTTRTIVENTISGVNIGAAVSATDADNDSLIYRLGGTDAAAFRIVSTTGQLRTRDPLDYETKTSYTVTVSVSDSKGGTDSITVAITVTDINEVPVNNAPVFTDGTSTTRTIAENTASGQNIGAAVSATDADNDSLTYRLSGTDAATFRIVSTTGQLRTRAALDYETQTSYSVTVSVSDSNGGSDSITVTINVRNVHEQPYPLYGRTQQVQAAIVAAVPGANAPNQVTAAHLAKITHLWLHNRNITSLKAGDFKGLTSLTNLGLNDNSIRNISPLRGLTTLKGLDLNDNSISDISPLENMPDLAWLDLSFNSISNISPLEDLTKLATLDLSANSISNISALEDLTKLRTLRLWNNSVSNISALEDLTALTVLSLSYNSISDISVLKNLTKLKGLGLYANSITDISPLKDLTSLTTLGLIANSITDISPLEKLTKLTWLNLHSNSISDISPLKKLTKLTWLTLTNNSVSDISALEKLTALTELYIWHNSISDISPLKKLTALTTLSLSRNSISDISPLKDLTALTLLALGANSISDVSALEKLTALTKLYIWNNSISDISPLEDLTSLTFLTVDTNSISDVSALEGLTKLTELYVSDNPISDYGPLRRLKTANPDVFININLTNNPPEFGEGTSTTRMVAENTTSGTNIGEAISATDADGHTLTYTLGGTDADSFSIVSTSGQLKTKAALDFETQTAYTVTVTVYDGNHGGDRITVTINVTDVANAAPSVPTPPALPETTALLSNFPNPFNPETWIPYQLAKPAEVTLTIYDIRGVVVRELRFGHQPAGMYRSRSRAIHWDGRNEFGEKVASDVYFYTFTAGDYTATRKMLIRK